MKRKANNKKGGQGLRTKEHFNRTGTEWRPDRGCQNRAIVTAIAQRR